MFMISRIFNYRRYSIIHGQFHVTWFPSVPRLFLHPVTKTGARFFELA
nr:MAG TPA: hypothetical protein [Caudoviricetes sp.]